MAPASESLSDRVKGQMSQLPIHDLWEKTYRTTGYERFFEQAFDHLVGRLRQPAGSSALDIGCGVCANTIRLARRGYVVSAGDYSEPILERARENLEHNGLSDKVSLSRQDILGLTYPDGLFDLTLCWGVLMHIPEAERALGELVRVTKPGGFLVLEEINDRSPEALVMRTAWGLLKKGIKITRTRSGHEQTCAFEGRALFWRHTNPRWLIDELARHSCRLVHRGAGVFTEMTTYVPGKPLKSALHAWNRFSERWLNLPNLAYHNVYIFQKAPE